MRIIGGKDYYDGARAYGADPDVVFDRTGRSMKAEEFRIRRFGIVPRLKKGSIRWISRADHQSWEWKETTYIATLTEVVLCGVYYSGVKVGWERYSGMRRLTGEEFFWEEETFLKYIRARGNDISENHNFWEDQDKKGFSERKLEGDSLNWILENRVSVATRDCEKYQAQQEEWLVNCDSLKELKFAKKKDPFQTFQELSIWVGGVLPREGNPMVQITDDKIKIQKAGMDVKTSFRHPVKMPRRKDKV